MVFFLFAVKGFLPCKFSLIPAFESVIFALEVGVFELFVEKFV